MILNLISDIPFYFLPFLLAISSARKLKVNEYLGICVAGALMYPTFVAAVDAGSSPFTFLGFVIPVFKYADSVFPVILGVGLLAMVYRFIDKFIPNVLKMVIVPTVSLLVTIPLTYLILKGKKQSEILQNQKTDGKKQRGGTRMSVSVGQSGMTWNIFL